MATNITNNIDYIFQGPIDVGYHALPPSSGAGATPFYEHLASVVDTTALKTPPADAAQPAYDPRRDIDQESNRTHGLKSGPVSDSAAKRNDSPDAKSASSSRKSNDETVDRAEQPDDQDELSTEEQSEAAGEDSSEDDAAVVADANAQAVADDETATEPTLAVTQADHAAKSKTNTANDDAGTAEGNGKTQPAPGLTETGDEDAGPSQPSEKPAGETLETGDASKEPLERSANGKQNAEKGSAQASADSAKQTTTSEAPSSESRSKQGSDKSKDKNGGANHRPNAPASAATDSAASLDSVERIAPPVSATTTTRIDVDSREATVEQTATRSTEAQSSSPQANVPAANSIGPETEKGNTPDRLASALSPTRAMERGEGPLTENQQARLVQRVAKAFDIARTRGESTVRLRLSPPELGSLKIDLQLESGSLVARLEVESRAAREVLLDNLPTLRQRLAEQNIRVDQFDVELLDQQAQEQWQGGHGASSEHDRSGGEAARSPSAQRETASPVVEVTAKQRIEDKVIDVTI